MAESLPLAGLCCAMQQPLSRPPSIACAGADLQAFDPATGKWSFVRNVTVPRGDCQAAAAADDCLLVMGGAGDDGFQVGSCHAAAWGRDR